MMMHAYQEMYLDNAMKNLGDMLDYAINGLKYDPEDFFMQFINSGVSTQFENGNPKYIAGLSGIELANAVIYRTEGRIPDPIDLLFCDKTKEYWAGWILAYYQWLSAHSFEYLYKHGLTMTKLFSMYGTLHEADVSKFVSIADQIIAKSNIDAPEGRLR